MKLKILLFAIQIIEFISMAPEEERFHVILKIAKDEGLL